MEGDTLSSISASFPSQKNTSDTKPGGTSRGVGGGGGAGGRGGVPPKCSLSSGKKNTHSGEGSAKKLSKRGERESKNER